MAVTVKEFVYSYVRNPSQSVLRNYSILAPYIPETSEYSNCVLSNVDGYVGMLGEVVMKNWAVDAIPLNAPTIQVVGDLEFTAIVNGKQYNILFHYPLPCYPELVNSGSITDENGNTYDIPFGSIPVQSKMFGRTYHQLCTLFESLVSEYVCKGEVVS